MPKQIYAVLVLIAASLLLALVACSNCEYIEVAGSEDVASNSAFGVRIIDNPDSNSEGAQKAIAEREDVASNSAFDVRIVDNPDSSSDGAQKATAEREDVVCDSAFDVRIINNSDSGSEDSQNESAEIKELFLLDDLEYPYTGIPRIVIETEKLQAIKDRETEIPAKLQIWGAKEPNSDIMELTIKGRGNSSWTEMPKKSYKIELKQGKGLLGMPKDKDWALIANYSDKTLMKNYLAYRLAADVGMEYAPRCEFAELYLNGEYQGVYLLTETIKVNANRVNIPKNDKSYLVEFDEKYRADEQVFFSDVLTSSKPFRLHFPKNASDTALNVLSTHIQSFEKFLLTVNVASLHEIESWIDVDAFAKHFWIQEFSKNPDANYLTSVYFTWMENRAIKMGPVWDFDIAFAGFGGYDPEQAFSDGWRTKDDYWSEKLFSNKEFESAVGDYWGVLRPSFENALFIIDSLYDVLKRPAEGNFKKWDVLQKNEKWLFRSVESYEEAVAYLKDWIAERMKWMDENCF